MKRSVAIIALIILLASVPAFAVSIGGKYRWGYNASDSENYPKDYFPDNNPRAFIVDYKAKFKVTRNPSRENVILYLPLPDNNPIYQRVLSYKLNPEPTRIIQSRYGYKIAEYNFGPLMKDMILGLSYHAEVELYRVDIPLDPDIVGGLADIPEQIRQDYTGDGRYYKLNDPVIKTAAKQAVGNETNLLKKAKRIWLYTRERLYYDGDGKKDPAPVVLRQGHGTCTEYSFLMIALLRSHGIPARYISGSKIRAKPSAIKARDKVFHKFVEVYLPNIGWIPMESTAGNRYYTEESMADEQIGKLKPHMLFFQREPEPGLAPLDPRFNVATWINKRMGAKVRLAGENFSLWERVRNRAR